VHFLQTLSRALLYIAPVSLIALAFVFPVAWRGWRRVSRLMRPRNTNATVYSIWHGNDEAISFLGGIERLTMEPFPKGAIARSSRFVGLLWGVRTVLVMLAFAVLLLSLTAWLNGRAETAESDLLRLLGVGTGPSAPESFYLLSPTEWPFYVAMAGIIAAPLLFAGPYLLVRLGVSVLGEGIARNRLNEIISSAMRGIAFGRDNDERFGDVSVGSHTFGARPHRLEGDVAQRMAQRATGAVKDLLEKYRSRLFSVGADNADAMREIAVDSMTWDSLVHTTYFDQPEITAMLADHIAAEQSRDGGR
jgi:hypothetical protein